jgi:superfamily II DNA or RNA helicase/ribosomal protein L7Ae-like RNA K-turn-binding protein
MTAKHIQASNLIARGIFDGLKNFHEFEKKVSSLFELNTKVQGDAFEVFVEAYLATQPIIQCQESWPVGFIPSEIREALNLPNDSKGIDGVYKSALDVFVPYQVKFRSNRPALGFNEVAPFLGITEKATDRLLITNCDTIAIDVQNRTGIRSLRGVDFDQLTEEDFNVIENWLKKKPNKRQPLTPDPYQVEALTNIANHLGINDRGTVVMACGTGKTLVALWAAEQSNAKSILVLVPSLTLLQQTLEEWSVHNSWGKDFSYLCVCSDPSVNLKNDEIEIDPSDVPFRIDTNPEIVKRYLDQNNGKTKIVFSTYQSSQVVSQATKGGFEFDIAVFDEAHKTTGITEGRFSLALKDENIKIRKRLFLTATPKHYDINKRDKHGEFKFVSMDDESVYGKRAHTLTFGDAAAKGIICPYKVVITLIDKQQVDDFALKNGITLVEGDSVKAKWVASQIAVSSAVKHTSATKIITFHSRVKTAREFASDEVYGIKKFVSDFDVFHVHGKQKSNERKETISKFRKASRSIITNAKCLTEGVDVPAVDMVAFVDPRHSKIDIAQAVGRAMRKPRGGDKKVGYIVVPIFAESTEEQGLDKAIKSESFDDVALILNSLLEQDNDLAEIIRESKVAIGRGEVLNPKRFKDKVEVIGPIVGLDELSNTIFAQTVDRLGESWDEWFGRLLIYRDREGHCKVPKKYSENNYLLGSWVNNQRHNQPNLTAKRFNSLDAIGFDWDPFDNLWEEGFSVLKNFYIREGHTNVHQKYYEKNFLLGGWVNNQRAKKSALSEDRIKRLDEIGFVWSSIQKKWDKGFSFLKKFKEREGHCRVLNGHYEEDFLLGSWVQNQRFNKLKLNSEKISRLNELGFAWEVLTEQWEENFNALKKFKDREGHCKVPHKYVEDGLALGYWVGNQRGNSSSISVERIARLNELGFVWDLLELKWEEGFSALKKFKEREGHCRVLSNHIEDTFPLGGWVSRQRTQKVKISTDRIIRLNELGFIWAQIESQWEEGLESLKAFKAREGHCLVPSMHTEEGFNLGNWISNQRAIKSSISFDRLARLNELGFIWEPLELKWEENFNALKKFKEREGHCLVPYMHIEDGLALGGWVGKQRRNSSSISVDRSSRLNELGFIWDVLAHQWEQSFKALKKFKDKEGHCMVPQRSIQDGLALGAWVSVMRQKKSEISDDRLIRLNELGFIWDVLAHQWEENFKALKKYRDREGHCRVSKGHIEDGLALGTWVLNSRYKKSEISADRLARLNEIGFFERLS